MGTAQHLSGRFLALLNGGKDRVIAKACDCHEKLRETSMSCRASARAILLFAFSSLEKHKGISGNAGSDDVFASDIPTVSCDSISSFLQAYSDFSKAL